MTEVGPADKPTTERATHALTEHVTEQLDHLFALVEQHHHDYTDGQADGSLVVAWEPDGWWLSIVMPGHYAYEEEGSPTLWELVEDATTYYGGDRLTLWASGRGCQQRHPFVAPVGGGQRDNTE